MRVRIGDVVDKIVGDEDRFNTSLEYYVGGEHLSSSRIKVYNKGVLNSAKGKTLGYQFHYPFQKRDVLFMTKNPYLKKSGMVDFDGICSIATFVMRSKNEEVLLQEYLAIVMQTDALWNYLEANKSGSVNYFITWKTLERYEFELPGIEEQRKIAEIVWQMENTRAAYEKLLDVTDELVKSQFIEMFGDQKNNPYGLPTMTLGDACEFYSGTGFPNEYQGNSEGRYPFYKVGDISRNVQNGYKRLKDCDNYIEQDILEKLHGTVIPEGTVVFAKIGEALRLNRRAITNCECLIDNNAMGIKPSGVLELEYFFQFMNQLDLGEYAGATAMPSVRKSVMESITIIVPDIEQQRKFSELSIQSDKSKFELKNAIEKVENLMRDIMLKET